MLFKQRCILKNKIKKKKKKIKTVGSSRSTIYFKINIYKFIKKFPRLKH